MRVEINKEIDGLKIEVKLEKKVVNKSNYADGWNVDAGKEIYEGISVSIEKGGKKASVSNINFFYVLAEDSRVKAKNPQAHARFGDTYISEKVYRMIKEAIDEAYSGLEGSGEIKEIEETEKAKELKIENNRKENIEKDAQREANGYCNKCGSFCHGDCQA